LRPLLREAPGGCRVLWTTSIESHPRFYEEAQDDFQMLKTNKSYEAIKYATELVAHGLNVTSKANAEKEPKIRHIVTHPGIVASSILLAYNGIFFHYLMIAAFYLVSTGSGLNERGMD
jgi:pimeloyl-CoA synthetase